MSDAFRDLLRKIGSGPHTGKDLTRDEARQAMTLLLHQEATPAQIGAFLIAHRIKRPTGQELAGMLDAYDQMGPQLQPLDPGSFAASVVTVLGTPYDGRSRTFPISILTALILAARGCPVILHGGDRMPTKYGVPLIDIWRGLGADWQLLSLEGLQSVFKTTGVGFLYLPNHFPAAHALVPYRDQIGKRPPLATLELIWAPYAGPTHLVAGFVHPPTENFMREALGLRGQTCLTTIKGLEGSCDLPRSRTAILGYSGKITAQGPMVSPWERLCLHPRDYGFAGQDVRLESIPQMVTALQGTVAGEDSSLLTAAIWNGGFHFWRHGLTPDLPGGFDLARELLRHGRVAEKLQAVCRAIAQSAQKSPQAPNHGNCS